MAGRPSHALRLGRARGFANPGTNPRTQARGRCVPFCTATGGPAATFWSDEERLGARLLVRRLNAVALDLFAGFGLLLAAMGVYGSVAYAVARRTREIGVRIALGAGRASVLGLVARRGLLVATAGVSIGTAGALALTRVLRSFVLGTSVTNPWVFAGCRLLMIGVAGLAILDLREEQRSQPRCSAGRM
jgi:predicted lysophospholipase L1 biosynthesis ABC-type transport system permease subunit